MIYTKDGKYYLKRPGKMSRIEAKLINGAVDFVPAGESIEIFGDKDLIGYSTITVDAIKEKLTKKVEKPVEKSVTEPKIETDKFRGLFESKKVTKNK